MKYIYHYNNKAYLVLREMNEYDFKNKDGVFNREILIVWRDYLGGDHVLKINEKTTQKNDYFN